MVHLLDDFHNIQTIKLPTSLKLSSASHMASNWNQPTHGFPWKSREQAQCGMGSQVQFWNSTGNHDKCLKRSLCYLPGIPTTNPS